jgi:hypothetical protein
VLVVGLAVAIIVVVSRHASSCAPRARRHHHGQRVNAAISVPCGHGEVAPASSRANPSAILPGAGCSVTGSAPGPLLLAIIAMFRRRRH